ncbi:GNAT family N-acetyltransferase [Acutalibacter sp. 1XD8-33]|uniref:GNAT family N-acetyltransferase n=1 Tax=Acutalibacter sp. 1XD8-33 TaxID=2320081 RepID=UPI000EA123F3|nr:GNAT family N-acetyltransferase [Acutalibacter sp. 1XD8-33]RKJ40270.1 GNAT family N-acetyltransferase [Acutalibacter sp. 1XD8-33]
MMALRRAKERDVPVIAGLYEQARAALKAAGVDQWQDGYPNGENALADIAAGSGYVLEEDGRVLAYACLDFGHEPTYDVIEQGAWLGRGEYGFLHRVVVDGGAKGRGAAGLFFGELKRQAKERGVETVRGDTHRDNKSMQRVMAKNGLKYRGIIHVEDGSERLAFEALIS